VRKPLFLAGGLTAALVLGLVSITGAAASDPPTGPRIQGAACADGDGVTVAVDFTPVFDVVDLRCATAGGTVAEAFTGAGFALGYDETGLMERLDGVAADWLDDDAPAYWSLYTSTDDGLVTGGPSTQWVWAQEGANAGPTAAGQAYLFEFYPFDDPKSDQVLALSEVRAHKVAAAPAVPTYSPGGPQAQSAAAWLRDELTASEGVLPGYVGSDDWGLTIDALAGLAAAGIGKDQFAASADLVYHSGEAYVGAASALNSKWPAVAKTVWALQIAGLDPSVFPVSGGVTRDLVAELRSTVGVSGEFGSGGSPFTWALGVLALARTADGVPVRAVAHLASKQCADGSPNDGAYGWTDGCSDADPDATALVLQALTAAGVPSSHPGILNAEAWLMGTQELEGGFATSWGSANANTTGLAAQALRVLSTDEDDWGLDSTEVAAAQAAAEFVRVLQITGPVLDAYPDTLTLDDAGAIAYSAADLSDAEDNGIDAASADSFRRATAQAIFALDGPGLGGLTAPETNGPPQRPGLNQPPDDGGQTPPPSGETPTNGSTPPSGSGTPTAGATPTGGGAPAPGGAGPAGSDTTPPAQGGNGIVLNSANVKVADMTWTGKRIVSGFTVTVNGQRLTQFTVSGLGKNTKIGRGWVTVNAAGSTYAGAKKVSFRIVPKAPRSVKSTAGQRQAKIVWRKVSKAQHVTGYEIQVRAKGAGAWSKIRVARPGQTSAVIAKLAQSSTYEARVRAYKKVDGTKYRGAWSAAAASRPRKANNAEL
jgi:hypothetical protein